ncbi:hypothetical protein HL658_36225 [Azospirillum sp. RWY-5-1]|uniref:Minor tail protein n=1 Tax=Azospirillum oleiclasticum TaxID=2735135 RepID=A0ABX2TN42_9PROT|nr:hypothetical protein [Azospirillum oleiclasticum]NYZ18015.1 hypothetical protein [Azospirillum oleiclasticum]NYZ25174.1 hypothetical protein [Azospirillum oleiclasticum]
MSMDRPTTAIDRARAGYWNADAYATSGNPGGLDESEDGLTNGLAVNIEPLLAAVGGMTQWTGEQAAAAGEAATTATAAAGVVASDRAAVLAAKLAAEAAAGTAVTAAYPLEPDEIAGIPSVLDLVLTDAMALPAGVFSRLGTATYWDAAGVLRTAAAGVPRFDHHPVTGRCRGLLIEGAATNLLLRSQEFDAAAWSKAEVTVTANAAAAPDGGTAMDKLVESAANGLHRMSQSVSLVSGQVYSFSCYARAGERSVLKLETSGGGWSTAPRVTVNLATGTVQAITGSPTSYGIEPVGGGVFRCWITATATATSGLVLLMLGNSASGEAIGYTGDGTSGLYLWGAQLEAGGAPTSYIATAGGTVTRAADVCALPTAGWWSATEGTLVVAWSVAAASAQTIRGVAALTDGAADYTALWYWNDGLLYAQVQEAGAISFSVQAAPAYGQRHRAALAWAANNAAASVDGSAPVTDASVVTTTGVTTLAVGSRGGGGSELNGWIERVTLLPRRVPDATLQLLTQG